MGMDFHFLQISTKAHQYNFKVYDTSGEQKVLHITLNIVRQSQGIILVFSLDDLNSFISVTNWIKKVREVNQHASIVIVGNKCDSKQAAISADQINKMVEAYQMKYYETSAYDGKNIVNCLKYIVKKAKKLKI